MRARADIVGCVGIAAYNTRERNACTAVDAISPSGIAERKEKITPRATAVLGDRVLSAVRVRNSRFVRWETLSVGGVLHLPYFLLLSLTLSFPRDEVNCFMVPVNRFSSSSMSS